MFDKVPTVLVETTSPLYPRLAMTLQPPCTRLILEDSTGAQVVNVLVGQEDINRLLDELKREEFLDAWAELRNWTPEWIEEAEIEEEFIAAVVAGKTCDGCEEALEDCECG